ncbi:MAG: rhomboid family intramembrane serine protease [Nanoarchaeota archaeon]
MSENNQFQSLLEKLHKAQRQQKKEDIIEAYLKLSEYHYNNSDFYKAKIILEKILQLNPNQPNINYYLGLININLENYNKAENLLQKEVKINPNNQNAKTIIKKLNIKNNIPLISITLIILNLISFAIIYPQISFTNALKYGVSYSNISIINAFSSIFFHLNFYHLFFNLIVLISFGLILEKNIGSIKFLIIYIISGTFANLIQAYTIPNSIIIGASSALFGILGALMMREPLLNIKLFGIIKTPIIITLGAIFILHSGLNYFLNQTLITANIAHYSGLFIGIFLVGIFDNQSIKTYYNWLFIVLGFGLIEYSIKNIFYITTNLKIITNIQIITTIFYIIMILTGLFLIKYSYSQLTKYQEIRGKTE